MSIDITEDSPPFATIARQHCFLLVIPTLADLYALVISHNQTASTMDARFKCASCLEDFEGPAPSHPNGHSICQDCFDELLRPAFAAHLKNELVPVRWGAEEISIDTVKNQFSQTFVNEYKRRLLDYAIPVKDRLYCANQTSACGRLLGKKSGDLMTTQCADCGGRTCAVCEHSIAGHIADHVCIEKSARKADPFKELKRGRDYQRCPGCGMAVYLGEACNHMTCVLPSCKQEFCYICGREAREGQNHWIPGCCPKYGQPGEENVIYDDRNTQRAPRNPQRRQRRLVVQRWEADLQAFRDLANTQGEPREPPEVVLRRIDRQEILSLHQHITAMQASYRALEMPVPEYLPITAELLDLLGTAIDVYTLHLETDEHERELLTDWTTARWADIEIHAENMTEEGWAIHPRIRELYNRYSTAANGRIDQLRDTLQSVLLGMLDD